MVHPYLRRRRGIEDEHYEREDLKAILKKHARRAAFQEQCMRLSIIAAGFPLARADELRLATCTYITRRVKSVDKALFSLSICGLTLVHETWTRFASKKNAK
jgi:DNA polymerase III alpha subunit